MQLTALRIFFGEHQRDYALISVLAGAIGFVLFHLDVGSPEQYLQSLAIYIMTYFAAVVSAMAHRTYADRYDRSQKPFIALFWKFVRVPYWLTVFTTMIYVIDLDPQVGRILVYSGYLTLVCALASIIAWLLRRHRTAS
jgi:hypothetical protein